MFFALPNTDSHDSERFEAAGEKSGQDEQQQDAQQYGDCLSCRHFTSHKTSCMFDKVLQPTL